MHRYWEIGLQFLLPYALSRIANRMLSGVCFRADCHQVLLEHSSLPNFNMKAEHSTPKAVVLFSGSR